jgi:hypothetical protein
LFPPGGAHIETGFAVVVAVLVLCAAISNESGGKTNLQRYGRLGLFVR